MADASFALLLDLLLTHQLSISSAYHRLDRCARFELLTCVPNSHPHSLQLLACIILQSLPVVIFQPEGENISAYSGARLVYDIGIDDVVMLPASKVKPLVGFYDLIIGDPDIIQGDRRTAMTEDLLKQ